MSEGCLLISCFTILGWSGPRCVTVIRKLFTHLSSLSQLLFRVKKFPVITNPQLTLATPESQVYWFSLSWGRLPGALTPKTGRWPSRSDGMTVQWSPSANKAQCDILLLDGSKRVLYIPLRVDIYNINYNNTEGEAPHIVRTDRLVFSPPSPRL